MGCAMMEQPLPNNLDNALSLLIPAVKKCSDPLNGDSYLDLGLFEDQAQMVADWPKGQ